ncbi:hypothetical protein P355_5377 [Burkholderia cenocepacia KC-01]|nr:hypothetical protein P355_5377 [Burkholderia cenocepacia KC-01]
MKRGRAGGVRSATVANDKKKLACQKWKADVSRWRTGVHDIESTEGEGRALYE